MSFDGDVDEGLADISALLGKAGKSVRDVQCVPITEESVWRSIRSGRLVNLGDLDCCGSC